MINRDFTIIRRRTLALVATAAVSMSMSFAVAAVSRAEPYNDDDDGGSSYVDGGDTYGGGDGVESGGNHEDGGFGGDHEGGGDDGVESGGNHEDGGFGGSGSGSGTQHGSGQVSGGGGLVQPTEVQAPPADVDAAAKSSAMEVTASEVSSAEISTYLESVESTISSSTVSSETILSSPVSQWNSRWVGYDRDYRPVFINPYNSPMQVVYDFGGRPRRFTVAPQRRAVLDVADPGVYSFTAITRPPSGPPTNISVGSFSGGDFQPDLGQAPPQKSVAVQTSKNPLVQVKFVRGTSDPFRVSSLVELGKDEAVNGATKVLLDGEIPAWGEWSKNSAGEAQFEITETQLLPGLKPPGQDPLPGYRVQLAAASRDASDEHNRNLLVGVAVTTGVLALAAIGAIMAKQRRCPVADAAETAGS